MIIASKAYDAQERVLDLLHNADKNVVILSKRHRAQARHYDRLLYQARHLIEQFFNKLKHDRGITTRCDKTARNFLGTIQLAATVVWRN